MLIPLGIWAASGAGSGAAAGAYELISTANGTGSSAVITFSSIPSTYKHLQIRSVGRHASVSANTLNVTFNGATSASYAKHRLYADGTNVAFQSTTSNGSINLTESLASGTSVANQGWPMILDILDYAVTTKNVTLRAFTGGIDGTGQSIALQSGFFDSTSAISSITLTAGGNLSTISRFSLYGIKG
jgi:archaellum component FlaF (FlaF/FlaG flagellin family)